jgi:GDP-4-dehydro-6-deoxy-D-mannose reductase
MVEAYWLAIEKCTPGELYLIGSDEAEQIFTYRQIIEKLIAMSEIKNVTIEEESKFVRPTSVPRLIGDTSKFRNLTGWKPKISINEILQDTLNYWRDFVKNDLY